MRSFRYVVADVFTDRPLTGNQVAVFTDARELPEDLLQRLALEIGFSNLRSTSRRRFRFSGSPPEKYSLMIVRRLQLTCMV